jgi:ribA/ribD-fused uncharacterized protein
MKKIVEFRHQYNWLSNFFASPIESACGLTFPTAEHCYQAQKSLNPEIHLLMSKLCFPSHAKKFGQTIRIRPGWMDCRVAVMRNVIEAKFEQHPVLANCLVNTDDAELIEGNEWGDRFWGVYNGEGENWLGRILMERRSILQGKIPSLPWETISRRS